ncbi:hypothetical protein BsWGS_26278 [Bradybaena similaris]
MPNVAMNGKTSNAKYITAEEGGTQVIFAGNQCSAQRRRSAFPWLDGWTRLELMLALMSVFLAVAVVVLITMLASRTPHTGHSAPVNPQIKVAPQKRVSSQDPDTDIFRNHTFSDNSTFFIPPGLSVKDICLTPGCVTAASRLLTSMDNSVAPCDNFFDFACGNWNKLNIIPADKSFFNTFAKLGDDIQALLKNLLEKPIDYEHDIEATVKAKKLYMSCMNESQIDSEGLEPVRRLLADLGTWPILHGDAWDADGKVSVLDLIVKLTLYNNKILIDQWVSADDKDSEINIIQLDQADLGMPSPDYFLHDDAVAKLPVYKKYAQDVAVMFGADPKIAQRDVEEMVKFEIKLANITIPREERRDNEKMYNKMMIKEFAEMVPGFNWLDYLQKIYATVGINITEAERIVVYAPSYFQQFAKLYQTVDKRVKVNYLFWRIMMNRINNLPSQNRSIKNEYLKVIFGSHAEPARWYECVTFVNDNMGNALGRLFVEAHFDEGSRETALEMIHDIRNAFYEILNATDWMDEKTKKVAKEKAEAISEKIGYADSILNDTALNEEYAGVEFYPDRYFNNVIGNLKHTAILNLKRLKEPVDRTKWSTTPAVVNAFYSSTKNQIMFPAAILQPPFYSKDYPKSLNYGGIGMVIGHEITHGFDDRGRQYDKKGILVQWWDDEVIKRFKERAQCIIDQYSNYTLPEVNMKLNGIQCQGENIADNGGLKEAYMAYRKYADEHNHSEPRLPGLLQFTSDQLFFINFAQVWCGVMRPEAAINRIKTGVHSPGRFRVIGTLQNLQAFSDAFHCPIDSYMNRKEKCTVW